MIRIVAIAAALAGSMFLGTPARACDSNYPWLCKPVPSIDPPESAVEPSKPAGKPLPIANRRAATRTAAAVNASRSSLQASRKSAARQAAARRWAERGRRAKAAAARRLIDTAVKPEPIETPRVATIAPPEPPHKPVIMSEAGPARESAPQSSTGFAGIWANRSAAAAEPARVAAEVEPAPVEPVPVVAAAEPVRPTAAPVPARSETVASQAEVNEIDLAATDAKASSDSSWLRNLFVAFGGLLAVGSALRLFI